MYWLHLRVILFFPPSLFVLLAAALEVSHDTTKHFSLSLSLYLLLFLLDICCKLKGCRPCSRVLHRACLASYQQGQLVILANASLQSANEWRARPHLSLPALPPSLYRALYFTAYSQAKQLYNRVFSYESPLVHLSSAISAGAALSDKNTSVGPLGPNMVCLDCLACPVSQPNWCLRLSVTYDPYYLQVSSLQPAPVPSGWSRLRCSSTTSEPTRPHPPPLSFPLALSITVSPSPVSPGPE